MEQGLKAPEDAQVDSGAQSWTVNERSEVKHGCVTIGKYQLYLQNTLLRDPSLEVEEEAIGMAVDSLYVYELLNSTVVSANCAVVDNSIWGENALNLEVHLEGEMFKSSSCPGAAEVKLQAADNPGCKAGFADAATEGLLDVTEEGFKYSQQEAGMHGSARFSENVGVEEQLNSCFRSVGNKTVVMVTNPTHTDQEEENLNIAMGSEILKYHPIYKVQKSQGYISAENKCRELYEEYIYFDQNGLLANSLVSQEQQKRGSSSARNMSSNMFLSCPEPASVIQVEKKVSSMGEAAQDPSIVAGVYEDPEVIRNGAEVTQLE